MIDINLKEEDCSSRKQYLVMLAISYIRDHTGFVGIDDSIFYDEAVCDGYALADDLAYEFEIEED